jgi:lipoprotein-anchoring transpeptidase ErfK/SrfK
MPSLLQIRAGAVAVLAAVAATPSAAQARADIVPYKGYEAGTVVVSTSQRKLYFVLDDGTAVRYPVAVARPGKEWSGTTRIHAKFSKPDWIPPAEVKADHPELPDLIPGGSPHNPMGVAALTLDRDEIAIHGTTAKMRASIGTRASYGCIRMLNEDVSDLFERVEVGTQVVMAP